MEKAGTVQSLERALSLLELLAANPEGSRLTALARQAELAPSTAHRLLTTLERRGFAQFDAPSSHWFIGRKAFVVGIAFTRWQSLIAAAMPFLRRLRDLTRETANLGILEEGEVITVAQVESREIIRAIAPPGGRTPVLSSGMGKAIIATWPDEAIEAFVARHGLQPKTRHSLRSLDQLRAEIAQIREQGFALDNEEFTYGMRCVAAVIWDPLGEPVGGLSISALANRLPPHEMAGIGRKVAQLADQLSLVIGGKPPGLPPEPAADQPSPDRPARPDPAPEDPAPVARSASD